LSLALVTKFRNPEIKLLAVVNDHIESLAVLLNYPLNKPMDSQFCCTNYLRSFSQPVTEVCKMLVACGLL